MAPSSLTSVEITDSTAASPNTMANSGTPAIAQVFMQTCCVHVNLSFRLRLVNLVDKMEDCQAVGSLVNWRSFSVRYAETINLQKQKLKDINCTKFTVAGAFGFITL